MDPATLHRPVLVAEVLSALRLVPGAHVLDCTVGLGGHAARCLAVGARVTGIDRDPQARELARQRITAEVPDVADRFQVLAGTFAEVTEQLAMDGRRFDGVLADIGVSSLQLDAQERGFSLRSEAPLDLRMDQQHGETALELIDRLDEAGLADVLWQFGEERLSRVIARRIKEDRAAGGCATGIQLADTIRRAVRGQQDRHPALRTFQALRIAVNDELGQLDRLLAALPDLLVPGGRAVLISFHSLEDRRVKTAFRAHQEAGRYAEIARGVITASGDELAENPRSAPAKLRWAVAPTGTVGSEGAKERESEAGAPPPRAPAAFRLPPVIRRH